MNTAGPLYRRSAIAWVALIFCAASLCSTLWVTLHQTRPGGFFARYGQVSLGIAITAGTTANLLPPKSFHRKWLMVVMWTALIISFIAIYQLSR
jgi:hypothetical protein